MRVLIWHVHGSWMTSFVSGSHDYVIPVTADRGPDGRGRAETWDWPERAREVASDVLGETLRRDPVDVVVLQRPHEAELLRAWTGLRVGHDVPAVYLEHNTPAGPAVATPHHVLTEPALAGVPVVHVTYFNAVVWDCGPATTYVVEHGIPDPGLRYSGAEEDLAVVVNEPVRRSRVAGTDLMLRIAEELPVSVYGMVTDALEPVAARQGIDLRGRLHNVGQAELHARLGRHRAYLHPYRWTSLGLSLLEAMALGMPVLALATTEAPRAVPPDAGLVSCDVGALVARARRWMARPAEARECGLAARQHVLTAYSLPRFLDAWETILKEVVR